MPDVGRVFKEESTRLARKEVRTAVNPILGQLRELRKGILELSSRVARIEKNITRLQKAEQRESSTPKAEPGKDIRVSPTSVKKLRKRLKLSQEKMGKLLGVSGVTILNWEQAKSRPRPANKDAIAELRDVGVRDVNLLLEGLS